MHLKYYVTFKNVEDEFFSQGKWCNVLFSFLNQDGNLIVQGVYLNNDVYWRLFERISLKLTLKVKTYEFSLWSKPVG